MNWLLFVARVIVTALILSNTKPGMHNKLIVCGLIVVLTLLGFCEGRFL